MNPLFSDDYGGERLPAQVAADFELQVAGDDLVAALCIGRQDDGAIGLHSFKNNSAR